MEYKKLKEQLVSKKYSQDGLVAMGMIKQVKVIGGAIGSAINSKKDKRWYAFSRVNTKLVITIFDENQVDFKSAIAVDASKINKVKVKGFGFYSTLHLWTADGKKKSYEILKGAKDLKEIFKKMEINKKH